MGGFGWYYGDVNCEIGYCFDEESGVSYIVFYGWGYDKSML